MRHTVLTVPPTYYVTLGINALLLWPIASILTFYGIRHTQLSIRESLTQSRLIFVPLIAVLFLGESVTLFAALGTILVFVGILIVVYKPELSLAHPDMRGIGFVLVASLLIAITSTFDKHNVSGIDYLLYSFLIYIIQTAVFLLFLTKERRNELRALAKERDFFIIFGGALCAGLFYVMQLWLYRHLALHIAYPIIQISSAAALMLAVIFLKERDRIVFKVFGFCLAAAGAITLRLAT